MKKLDKWWYSISFRLVGLAHSPGLNTWSPHRVVIRGLKAVIRLTEWTARWSISFDRSLTRAGDWRAHQHSHLRGDLVNCETTACGTYSHYWLFHSIVFTVHVSRPKFSKDLNKPLLSYLFFYSSSFYLSRNLQFWFSTVKLIHFYLFFEVQFFSLINDGPFLIFMQLKECENWTPMWNLGIIERRHLRRCY